MRVARSRWTRNKRHGVALLRAKGAKKSLPLSFCNAPTLTQTRITPLYSRSPVGSTIEHTYHPLGKKTSDAPKIDTSLILKVWIRSSRDV